MCKFVRKVILLLLSVLLILGILIVICFGCILPQYENNYTAGLLDKVTYLKAIQEPKIVLIGNSNLAFGMNSQKMEEELGMPVVNMGFHGGLGNAFHEEMAKINVTDGDIVIICHSDYSDDDGIGDAGLAWITLENHYELWDLLRKSDIKDMLMALPNYMLKSYFLCFTRTGNLSGDYYYSKEAFNQYGDVKSGRVQNGYVFHENSNTLPQINEICMERLNALNSYMTERGATLLVAGYPIADGQYTPAKDEYVHFQNELQNKLDCKVISDFTDYFLDYRYFYDTAYHLNDEGVEIRTNLLIKDVEQWMEQQTGRKN